MRLVVLALLVSVSTTSFADWSSRGRSQVTDLSPSTNNNELCILPKPMAGLQYPASDATKETELCAMSLYPTPTNPLTYCPKINSTNPGTNFVEIPAGQTAEQVRAACAADPKVKGKFKSSISCSYTPSILVYYHFSRYLGIGRVPVSVLRTIDKTTHLGVTDQALQLLAGRNSETIYQTWANFKRLHANPSAQRDLIFENNWVIGALSQNPSDEENYREVSNVRSYDTRYADFQRGRPFVMIADARPLSDVIGAGTFAVKIQKAVQAKDVSDMIFLDYILSQQDRIGNIHYKQRWYRSVNGQIETAKIENISDGIIDPTEKATMEAQGYTAIKEMLMKDNDCGVTKSNNMKIHGIMTKVKHISQATYDRLQALSAYMQTPAAETYFRDELLMTAADVTKIKTNMSEVIAHITTAVANGTLRTDANPADFAR